MYKIISLKNLKMLLVAEIYAIIITVFTPGISYACSNEHNAKIQYSFGFVLTLLIFINTIRKISVWKEHENKIKKTILTA